MRLEKFRVVGEGRIPVAPGHYGWTIKEFSPGIPLGEKDPASDDERCLVLLGPAPGVEWARQKSPADFMRRC